MQPLIYDRAVFIKRHILMPLTVFFLMIPILEFTPLEMWLSEHFFDSVTRQWPLKDDWWVQQFLHKGGQKFSKLVGVILLVTALYSSFKGSKLYRYRKALWFLFLASVTGPALVAVLKSQTHIYCPWSLKVFSGDKPYIRLFDAVDNGLKVGHCFPSGHASGGFAFISLYFFFLVVKPRYRFYGLAFGLILGLVYGVAQQMRGAHFLSHDVFALVICWFSSVFWFLLFYYRELKPRGVQAKSSSV